MVTQNIEDMVSQTYADFRKYHNNGYSLMKSKYTKGWGYAELGIDPNPGRRYANYERRTKVFNKMISDYLNAGFDILAAKQNSLMKSKIFNNIFRSRITFLSDNLELYIWVPKFSWLFGNRIKMKYRIKRPNVQSEEMNIFRRFINFFSGGQ